MNIEENFTLIVDAMFGFSFKPPIREPYANILQELKKIKTPIFSVDIPSGWDVEKGNIHGGFNPSYLISLTLPKIGVKSYKGKHFLGGRFIPDWL